MTSWEKILQHMERRVNPHSFATWFQPTKQEGADNGTLVVRVPSRPFRKRLTETYGELLQAVLVEVGMPDVQLNFICNEPDPPLAVAMQPIKQAKLDFDNADHQLNLRYLRGRRFEPVCACSRASGSRSPIQGI
jgi:chromosomal replication initiation ATPase DnaA